MGVTSLGVSKLLVLKLSTDGIKNTSLLCCHQRCRTNLGLYKTGATEAECRQLRHSSYCTHSHRDIPFLFIIFFAHIRPLTRCTCLQCVYCWELKESFTIICIQFCLVSLAYWHPDIGKGSSYECPFRILGKL